MGDELKNRARQTEILIEPGRRPLCGEERPGVGEWERRTPGTAEEARTMSRRPNWLSTRGAVWESCHTGGARAKGIKKAAGRKEEAGDNREIDRRKSGF